MNKYENGKIYKISGGDKVYIGSTICSLPSRMAKHRYDYRQGKNRCCVSSLFDEYGINMCSIELIEDFPCSSKHELEERERYWIQTMECINITIPHRTPQEYYKDNLEKIKDYKKEWADENKERLKEYKKQWYLNKKSKLLQ
jgi:hypothetical protein